VIRRHKYGAVPTVVDGIRWAVLRLIAERPLTIGTVVTQKDFEMMVALAKLVHLALATTRADDQSMEYAITPAGRRALFTVAA